MRLEELQVYQLAMRIGEETWRTVDNWSYFVKDAFGKQLIRRRFYRCQYCRGLWKISLQRKSELLLLFQRFFKGNSNLAYQSIEQESHFCGKIHRIEPTL
jgi:hypothetical protein